MLKPNPVVDKFMITYNNYVSYINCNSEQAWLQIFQL